MKIRPIHTFQVKNTFPVESGVIGHYPLTVDHGFIVFRVTKPSRKPSFGFLALLYPDHPDVIRPHEQVISQKVESKKEEAKTSPFSTNPVCLLHEPNERLTEHLTKGFEKGKVIVRHDRDGFHYEYAVFDDSTWADKLTTLFENQKSLVIADGHHRTAAYFAMREDSNEGPGLFSAILSLDHVEVRSYHRMIRIKKESRPRFYDLLEDTYAITKWSIGQNPWRNDEIRFDTGSILMHTGKIWSTLRPIKDSSSIRTGSADLLAQFEERVVDAFCRDIKPDRHDLMHFVSGREVRDLPSDINHFLFLFPPVSHDFLWNSSHRDEVLPAKSTWVEPHMPSEIIQVPNPVE